MRAKNELNSVSKLVTLNIIKLISPDIKKYMKYKIFFNQYQKIKKPKVLIKIKNN